MSKVFVRNNLTPDVPYCQLDPEKRYLVDLIKKFQPKTWFSGWTKHRSVTLRPPIVPSSPFGQENWRGAIQCKNSNRKCVFWKNEFERAFKEKLCNVFNRNNFTPERAILPIRPRKEVFGRFHQKIPTKNVVFRMDETSLRDTFAPNHAI